MNDISLTVRLPQEIDSQLKKVAKEIGMTKTTLIRIAIHDFLIDNSVALDFTPIQGNKKRITLDVNQLTKNILEDSCKRHNQSMNAVITAVSLLALERAARWLQSTAK